MEDFKRTFAVSCHRVLNVWALLWTSAIIVSSPSAISCQSVTITSNISEGEIVCPGETITFECVTRGAVIITWISDEYVGRQIEFDSASSLNLPVTGSADSNTIATLINMTMDGDTIVLVSELRIIASSVSLTPSVTCEHLSGMLARFPFRVLGEPDVPQVTTADYVMGTCELNVSVATPDGFTTGDTIQVDIDGRNVHNAMYRDNVTSLNVSYAASSCNFPNVSARIVDRCGREGQSSSNVTVDPGQLCDPSACPNDGSPPPSVRTFAVGVVVAIVVPIALLVIAALVFSVVMIALCCYWNSKKSTPKRVNDIHLESKNGEEDTKLKES